MIYSEITANEKVAAGPKCTCIGRSYVLEEQTTIFKYFTNYSWKGRVVIQGFIAGTVEEIQLVDWTFLENGKALLLFLEIYLGEEVIYEPLQVALVVRARLVVFKPDVI